MFIERSAALSGVASPVRTVPQVMRMVADLLEALPGLPELTVSVHESHRLHTSVQIQFGHRLAPQDKFPAVAQLLQHLGGATPLAKQISADGSWHLSGYAEWRGLSFSVFAATHETDLVRDDDKLVA